MILSGPQMCPCCGYNLRREVPLIAGRFAYYPTHGFYIDSLRFEGPLIGESFHSFIGSMMAARGRWVSRQLIADRAGTTRRGGTVFAEKSVAVIVCSARKRFAALGVPAPFEARPHAHVGGYRWTGPPVHELRESDFPAETKEAPTWPPPAFESPPKPPVLNLCG